MNRQDSATIMNICNYEITTIDQRHVKVKSMSKKGDYLINLDINGLAVSCSCNDFTYRGHIVGSCKHIIYINNLIM